MKIRIALFTAVSLAVIAAAVLPAGAQETAAAPTPQSALLAEGDAFFDQRADLEKAKAGMAKYQEALLKGEDPYGAYWRMARMEYWIGDHTASSSEKKRIFQRGIYHAKKAVALAPDKPEGHYWLGVAYGVYGEAKGVLKSLSLVKPIKEEMARVLAIDAKFDDGGADRILGRVYHELPGVFGGSKEKSLEHLLKSREMGPWVGLTRLYLADTYLSLDQVDKARAELDYLVTMEPHPSLIPETAREKELARERLKKKPFVR